jgi:hypothetical protein
LDAYVSQFTYVKVDWSEIKLSFIPVHFSTCGLKWIHMHPKKALVGWEWVGPIFYGV